jgi:hypothetical protein
VLLLRRYAPCRVRRDPLACLAFAGIAVVAAVMFLPGFSYGVTDKDPGGYTEHAFSIARTGSYRVIDPTLDGRIPGGPVLEGPGARFGALWIQPPGSDVIVPQFYHLWPSLLAVAIKVDGTRGLAQVPPLLGLLAVLMVALALRRAVAGAHWGERGRSEIAGIAAGTAAGLLLATNMLEVWQAKYPTSEISAQMLFTGALFGAVVAVQTGYRPAAGIAGVFVGLGFLDRADGFLVVLLAVAAGAALIAVRRWDPRATWFAVGLAVVLPHALWQAYSPSAALLYSQDNSVPSLAVVCGAAIGLVLLGVVVRPIGSRVGPVLVGRRAQVVVGACVTLGAAGLLTLGFLRPRLFGESHVLIRGQLARSYDEQILARLSWFLSTPAFALLLVGVAVVALRRWTPGLWVLLVPLLLIFPVYGLHAHNSVRLMWWSRRYVPTVLPLLMAMVALGLAAIAFLSLELLARWWGNRQGPVRHATSAVGPLVGTAGVLALVVFFCGQSLPLRSHSEFGGSFDLSARVAAVAGGRQGVFLWQRSPACCLYAQSLFGGALWLERDQISAILPSDATQVTGYAEQFRRAFPGQPEFVVWHGQDPPGLPGLRLEPVLRIQTSLSYWDETETTRPDRAISVPVDFVVYRVLA